MSKNILSELFTLPDFALPSRINKTWDFSGTDSEEQCMDQEYFNNYPHEVEYCYNSRGFRDEEWPISTRDLKQCVWCVGDSFTVGIGAPREHTWPYLLEQQLGRRCINVSLDGASNDWILRKIKRIIEVVGPETIVVQWSFLTRSEDPNEDLVDEQRRRPYSFGGWLDQFYRFYEILQEVEKIQHNTKIIHSLIPNQGCEPHLLTNLIQESWNTIAGPSWPSAPQSFTELKSMPEQVQLELKNQFDGVCTEIELFLNIKDWLTKNNLIEYEMIDMARDSHHYDIKTASTVAGLVLQQI